MNGLDTKIVEYIRESPDTPLPQLQTDIKKRFGIMLGVAQVRQALQSVVTKEKIVAVKEQAADGLSKRADRLQLVEDKLFELFEATPIVKEKLEVARELRQYIKQGTDLSGIHDENTDTVFVIEGTWSTETSDEKSTS